MNVKKVFQNCLLLSAEEALDFVKEEYRKLQVAIFSVMPDECFLKMWNFLDLQMVFMLSPDMIKKGVVNRKDICSLCSAEDCPFNKVDCKNIRIIKVKLLNNLYNN